MEGVSQASFNSPSLNSSQPNPLKTEPEKKPVFNFKFFKYLNSLEKATYFISFSIGLCFALLFIYLSAKSLLSSDAGLGGADLLFLSIVLIPFIIANKIRLKGLKRIPEVEKTTSDQQLEKQADEYGKAISSTAKSLAKWGIISIILIVLTLIGVYYLIFIRG